MNLTYYRLLASIAQRSVMPPDLSFLLFLGCRTIFGTIWNA